MEERVEALDRCVVLRAAAGDVERLLLDEPAIAVAALAGFARRVRESEQRLESLAFHQVPARLARTILELADRYGKMTPVGVRIDLRVTHGQLAELRRHDPRDPHEGRRLATGRGDCHAGAASDPHP